MRHNGISNGGPLGLESEQDEALKGMQTKERAASTDDLASPCKVKRNGFTREKESSVQRGRAREAGETSVSALAILECRGVEVNARPVSRGNRRAGERVRALSKGNAQAPMPIKAENDAIYIL